MAAPANRIGRQIPWLGMVSLACGGTLLFLFFTRPHLTNNRGLLGLMTYLGFGGLLTFWGAWMFLADLIPGLGRSRARRMKVSMPAEALAYVAILFAMFFGALLGKSNPLMLLFALLAGPFVINGSITLAMLQRISAKRRLPDHAVAGEWFSVELELENRKSVLSSWMLMVRDTVQQRDTRLEGRVVFTRVPPRVRQTGTYEIRLDQRGICQFGPLQLASRYPLGMMERAVVLEDSAELIVYPRIGILTDRGRSTLAHSQDSAMQQMARRGNFDDEFYRMREYQSGDSPRAVHWRTSARRNQLMVREFHQDRDHSLLLILDLAHTVADGKNSGKFVEAAVSAAATFCVDFCRRGGGTRLILGLSGQVADVWQGPGTEAALVPVMERLAVIQAGHGGGLNAVLEQAQAAAPRDARRILITTRSPHELRDLPASLANGGGIPFQTISASMPEDLTSYVQFLEDES